MALKLLLSRPRASSAIVGARLRRVLEMRDSMFWSSARPPPSPSNGAGNCFKPREALESPAGLSGAGASSAAGRLPVSARR